jgi:hypothetical protein
VEMLDTARQFLQVGIEIPTFSNQGLIDPDRNFNRDPDRDRKFFIKIPLGMQQPDPGKKTGNVGGHPQTPSLKIF